MTSNAHVASVRVMTQTAMASITLTVIGLARAELDHLEQFIRTHDLSDDALDLARLEITTAKNSLYATGTYLGNRVDDLSDRAQEPRLAPLPLCGDDGCTTCETSRR